MSDRHTHTIGIDFGTTNTVGATTAVGEQPTVLTHEGIASFPSILCFYEEEGEFGKTELKTAAGAAAFDAYAAYAPDCRLIQSFKNHLGSKSVSETSILGRRFTVDQLTGAFLRHFRTQVMGREDGLNETIYAGRPVRFWGNDPDDALATTRLRSAYGLAGFPKLEFVNESLAAAYFHVVGKPGSTTCLVADLGGGTSDFSIVRVIHTDAGITVEPLAQKGIGIAGDTLDYRIVQNVVSPVLGYGTYFSSFGKRLPVPKHIYSRFERWSEISTLKAHKTLADLRKIEEGSEHPDRIAALLAIIEGELALDLYRAVGKAKTALSSSEKTEFCFQGDGVDIRQTIHRQEFDAWIASDIEKIVNCMDETVRQADLTEAGIDSVFITGGTSFVPAVKASISSRFRSGTVVAGDEFVSVASGLAFYGAHQ